MKLHLPIPLRFALLAVCAVGLLPQPSSAEDLTITQSQSFLYRPGTDEDFTSDYAWKTFNYQGEGNDTITFTDISGYVFYGWYHNQPYSIGAPYSPTISFEGYAKVVFTGITETEKEKSYEAPGILTSYYNNFGTSEQTNGMLFENIGEVQITNNTGKLFGGVTSMQSFNGGLMPHFKNVGIVTIEHNNSPTYSNLIGNIDNPVTFEGISKGVSISYNKGSYIGGNYALLSRGGLTASASGSDVYFKMDGNEGGAGVYAILTGTLTLDGFAQFSLQNNKINNTSEKVEVGVEEVAFTNVRAVNISGNELRAAKGVGNLLSGSISGVEQMEVRDNYRDYEARTSVYGGEPFGLFGDVTITGTGSEQSSLLIANNRAGSTETDDETIMGRSGDMVIKNFNNVEISSNIGGYRLELENVDNFVFKNNNHNSYSYSGFDNYAEGMIALDGRSFESYRAEIKGAEKFDVSNNTTRGDGEELHGGAIFLSDSMALNAGNVSFVGNAAIGGKTACGGAIYSDSSLYGVMFNDCENVLIQGNYAQADKVIDLVDGVHLEGALGGAIFALNTNWLEFKNNQSVEIRGNYITDKKTYRLNAIFGLDLKMMVKAGAGDTFTCYDGITVEELHINGYNSNNSDLEDRIDLDTSYTGTVVFSGKYAEDDLRALNPNYTQEDLEKSKTILLPGGLTVYRGTLRLEDTTLETGASAGFKAKVVAGTLELDHATLRTNTEFDWPGMVLLVSKPEACVSMKNGSVLELNDMLAPYDISVYGAAWIPTARFEGTNNIIKSNQLVAIEGTWTFNVTNANATDPILKLEFEPKGDSTFSQFDTENQVFDIQFDKSTLKKGKYKLLTYDGSLGRWVYDGGFTFAVGAQDVADDLVHGDKFGTAQYVGEGELPTISGMASSKVVGIGEGKGDVYLVAEENSIFTLYFNNMNEPVAPARRPSTTLTWAGGNGKWGEGLGGKNPTTWNVPSGVSDMNFYSGDKVVITGNANIELVGNAGENSVRPDELEVNNAASEEVVLRGSIGISDVNIDSNKTSLTKKGAGKLTINTANAYTGGTVVEAGTLVTGNANALGVGGVTLNGGTLDMSGKAVGNTVTVKKAASITNGGAYAGKLTLDGGTLDGAVNLAQDAELKNGTVAGVLSGKGGVVVSGGAVTLSGANTYTGKTTVQSGTLTVSGSVASEQIEVQSGGTYSGTLAGPDLTVTLAGGTLKGDVTLDGGIALNSTVEGSTVDGKLNLAQGGKLGVTEGAGLSVKELVADGGELSLTTDNSGHLSVDTFTTTSNETTLNVGSDLLGLGAGTYELLTYKTLGSGSSAEALKLAGLGALHTRKNYSLGLGANGLTLSVSGGPADLTWDSANTNTWSNESAGGEWSSDAKDKHFYDGDSVTFDSAGDVQIEGKVNPDSITVKGDSDTTFKSAAEKAGALTGKATLTKEGAGTLDIQTDNSEYSGNIEVKGGTLKVGDDRALGRGEVNIADAKFDGAGHAVNNKVTLSGNSQLKDASDVANLTFAGGSTIKGEGDYTLAAGHTLTIDSTGKASSAETPGSSYSGNFTFAGGILKLNGGAFDLSGATVSFNSENGNSTLDLTEWDGLTYGDYALLQGHEGQWKAGADTQFNLSLDEKLQKYAELKVSEDGSSIELVIKRPAEDPAISSSLNRNQRATYQTLTAIAEQGTATGKLAEMADSVAAAQDARTAAALVDRLSGAELATILSGQTEGNMAHIRRLRNSIGTGHLVSPKHRTAAYVTGYNEDTQLERDAKGLGYKRVEWGGTVGVETGVNRRSVMGLALSSGRAYVTPDGGSRRYHEDNTRGDIYMVTYQSLNIRNTFSMGYGVHRFNVSRMLPDGSISKNGNIRGNSLNMGEEVAYTIKVGEKTNIEPFFAVESSFNRVNSFAEYGAGTASITAQDSEAWATDLSLGVRTTHALSVVPSAPSAVFTLQAALVASVGDNWEEMTLSYTGAPDMSYEVRPAKRNRWGLSLGTSVGLPLSENFSVIGGANATLRGDSSEFSGSVGLRFNF